jgi:hypothetical protein
MIYTIIRGRHRCYLLQDTERTIFDKMSSGLDGIFSRRCFQERSAERRSLFCASFPERDHLEFYSPQMKFISKVHLQSRFTEQIQQRMLCICCKLVLVSIIDIGSHWLDVDIKLISLYAYDWM